MSVISPHFEKVFNNEKSIDWSVLHEVKQREMRNDISGPLTYQKFEITIRKLVNHKAPGLNGVTGEAIKALEEDHQHRLYQILERYFNDKIDIGDWHWGNLKALPISGTYQTPTNKGALTYWIQFQK